MRWIASLTLILIMAACTNNPNSDSSPPPSNGYQGSGPAPLPEHAVVATAPQDQKAFVLPPTPPPEIAADPGIEPAALGLTPQGPKDSQLVQIPAEYAGAIDLPDIRKAIFDQINKDRAANGLPALYYDQVAEQAGNLQNYREVTASHMLGHYSTNGDMPYMRYSEVGGYDGESENWASAGIFLNQAGTRISTDPNVTPGRCQEQNFPAPTPANIQATLTNIALGLECGMLNEVPGKDGHRKAILDPYKTSVGIGIGVAIVHEADSPMPKLRLFMTEEFTDRILTIKTAIPLIISLGRTTSLGFRASMPPGFDFDQMMLFFEQRKSLTPDQAFGVNHYSLPNVFTLFLPALQPGARYSDETLRRYPDLQPTAVVSGGSLTLPLVFDKGTGVYTMVIWLKNQRTKESEQVTARSIFAVE